MKIKILYLIFFSLLFPSVQQEAYSAKKTKAEKLTERLRKIQKKGYMYGHQDDTFYGITWDWDLNRSDTYELVGDYPAVMGFDIGGIEMGDEKNLDSVPFIRIRKEIVRHHEKGGIVTISWHPHNPLLGTTAWIEKDTTAYAQAIVSLRALRQDNVISLIKDPKSTVRSVLPGGTAHESFRVWMERVGAFLLSLKDKDGEQVPLIFRPWHENNGSWFWWGQDNCSDGEFKALWNMLQDYVSSILPDNIIWCYSPNLYGGWNEKDFMRRYPGDDRVTLIGEDAYQWGGEEDFKRQLTADLDFISSFAQKHDKMIAMTECGYQNSPDPTWWTRVLKPVVEKYPVCYLLPWRNYSKDHFGASKDAKTAKDFKEWYKDKRFLFLRDIK